MTKKMLAAWIVCLLILVGAACTKDKTTEETAETPNVEETATSVETAETVKPAEPAEGNMETQLEISFMKPYLNQGEDGGVIKQQLEEKFNIKLTPVNLALEDPTVVDLMLASGDMAEFGEVPGKHPAALYDQKLTRSFPRAFVEKYAPNYAKMLNDEYPWGWKMYRDPDNSDNLIGLPGVLADEALQFLQAFRLDWLENVGIQPKGNLEQLDERVWATDEPFTQEELEKIFKAFTENDPDKNGKKDTFGFTGNYEYMNHSYMNLMGMFGFHDRYDFNVEENGKTVMWYASDRYKNFLKWFQAMYKAGYVDPEFVTNTFTQGHEKIGLGRIGTWQQFHHYMVPDFTHLAAYNVLNNDPQAKVLLAPPSLGASGFAGGSANFNPLIKSFIFREDVSDEKLIRILQFFDYVHFSDFRISTQYGEEGINWKWTGEPFKSAIEGIPVEVDYKMYHTNAITASVDINLRKADVTLKTFKYVDSPYLEKYALYPFRNDTFGQTSFALVRSLVGAALETHRSEFMFNSIVNNVDIDAAWEEYIAKLNSAGLKQLHDELNKAPLVADMRK